MWRRMQERSRWMQVGLRRLQAGLRRLRARSSWMHVALSRFNPARARVHAGRALASAARPHVPSSPLRARRARHLWHARANRAERGGRPTHNCIWELAQRAFRRRAGRVHARVGRVRARAGGRARRSARGRVCRARLLARTAPRQTRAGRPVAASSKYNSEAAKDVAQPGLGLRQLFLSNVDAAPHSGHVTSPLSPVGASPARS